MISEFTLFIFMYIHVSIHVSALIVYYCVFTVTRLQCMAKYIRENFLEFSC